MRNWKSPELACSTTSERFRTYPGSTEPDMLIESPGIVMSRGETEVSGERACKLTSPASLIPSAVVISYAVAIRLPYLLVHSSGFSAVMPVGFYSARLRPEIVVMSGTNPCFVRDRRLNVRCSTNRVHMVALPDSSAISYTIFLGSLSSLLQMFARPFTAPGYSLRGSGYAVATHRCRNHPVQFPNVHSLCLRQIRGYDWSGRKAGRGPMKAIGGAAQL